LDETAPKKPADLSDIGQSMSYIEHVGCRKGGSVPALLLKQELARSMHSYSS